MSVEWSKENNYAPSEVNEGNRWESQPMPDDLVKVAETVFNLNEQEQRKELMAHCANNSETTHTNCIESGWTYVQVGDPNGPIQNDYAVMTMAYSDSKLVQIAFALDHKSVWITRAYNENGATKWDEWDCLQGFVKLKEFSNTSTGKTGELQEYVVKRTGTYHIEAAGASGGLGSGASVYGISAGKGATLSGDFQLTKGDEIVILVGQQGSDSSYTNLEDYPVDNVSGGGGGATFVFKKINEVTDERYQFVKDEQAYEVLMVVAGGAGTGDMSNANLDISYRTIGGMPGGAAGEYCYTPENYVSYEDNVWENEANNEVSGGSIAQFVANDGVGGCYTKNSYQCIGGYGCGGAADNERPSGGGWTVNTNATSGVCSTSFTTSNDYKGYNGLNTGHGYCKIYCQKTDMDNNTADVMYNGQKVDIEFSYDAGQKTLSIVTIEKD